MIVQQCLRRGEEEDVLGSMESRFPFWHATRMRRTIPMAMSTFTVSCCFRATIRDSAILDGADSCLARELCSARSLTTEKEQKRKIRIAFVNRHISKRQRVIMFLFK